MKNSLIIFFVIAVSILSMLFLITTGKGQLLLSEEFNRKIDTVGEHRLTDQVLIEYEENIRAELVAVRNRRDLQQIYYALGFINQAQGNFREAQTYFLKSANLKHFANAKELAMLYRELAVNHVALNQMEEAYEKFLLSLQLFNSKNDEPLRASLYRRFADALITHSDQGGLALNLLKRGTQLNQKDFHLIETYIMIAEIYLLAGLNEFANAYLNVALDLSEIHGYEDYKKEITAKLMITNYLLGDHETVISLINESSDFRIQDASLVSLSVFLNSFQEVHGTEGALEQLESLHIKLTNDLKDEWFLLMKSQIMINDGSYADALANLENNFMVLEYPIFNFWSERMRVDIQYAMGEIDDKNHPDQTLLEILELKTLSNDFYLLVIHSFLEDFVEQENFELAYQVKKDRLSLFNTDNEVNLSNFLHSLRDYPLTRKGHSFILMSASLVIGLLGIVIYGYIKYIKKLHVLIDNQRKVDVLTHTLTHESLYKELEVNIENKRQVTFILFEIENLEKYNKTFGYLAGDSILKQSGNVLSCIFPNSYVSRHDGNQFLVASYNPKERIDAQLELVKNALEELDGVSAFADEHNKPKVNIGISSGLLTSVIDIDTYIKKAHEGLKISKIKGEKIIVD